MIEVKDLEYTYPGKGEKTIKGISFSIGKGEIFGFLGPSGAGKSTTQKILIGLLNDYKGHVTVMNKEIKLWDKSFYEKVGISFELPNLYSKLTGLENLKLISSFYSFRQDPFQLLKMVGLEASADVKVSKYSKGMKMRLNFARAFINNPDLLFLDEPTSGLDPVNSKNIKDIVLQKKAQGKTIFLTTHNMSVAEELCDRVAFIVDGEIKIIDSPKELKINNGKKTLKIEYYNNENTVQKEFNIRDIGFNEDFLNILRSNIIKTIHTQEATLEDVFIRVTGRKLL